MTSNINKIGAAASILLVIIIVAGTVFIWSQYHRPSPVTISLAPETEIRGSLFLEGAVHNPGLYPLEPDDTVEGLIRSAGGPPKPLP